LIDHGHIPVLNVYEHVYPNGGFTIDQHIDLEKLATWMQLPANLSTTNQKEYFELGEIKKMLRP
jgi:hypothetical protein